MTKNNLINKAIGEVCTVVVINYVGLENVSYFLFLMVMLIIFYILYKYYKM